MKRTTIIIISLALCLAAWATNEEDPESRRRILHITELYNHDLNDSLIHQATRDLEYHRNHQCWENYYETWMHMVNTYVFMGKVNKGLQEVKQIHADATDRNDKYGLGLANYAMGNAYQNMGYLDEAITCYRQSMQYMKGTNADSHKLNDVYSYYCDALNVQKKYEKMESITSQWKVFLDSLVTSGEPVSERSSKVWFAYYYIARAQHNLGLNRLNEAARDIDEVAKRSADNGDFISMSVLYYRAQLYLQQGDYQLYTATALISLKHARFPEKKLTFAGSLL